MDLTKAAGSLKLPATLTDKLLRIMKITTVLILAAALTASASGHSQRVTLSLKDAPLEKAFREIQKQTGYDFLFTKQMLKDAKPISIQVNDAPLQDALNLCLKGQSLGFVIENNAVVISQKAVPVLTPTPDNAGASLQLAPPPLDIRGRIINENGEPVIASITIKGTRTGTTSNDDGLFTLKAVDENAVLVITATNIETREIVVGSKTDMGSIQVKMKETALNEVILNKGYYTEKQKFSVGNVGKVTAKDIEKQPVNNPLLALQGRVPGIEVTQTSGLPGAGIIVRIQGQNSLQNGNGPLYIVDGVPVISEIPVPGISYSPLPNSGENYIRQFPNGRGNALSFINPSDIESIEVLKGADATAIYGSRAANGAILITTKKGKAGKASLSIDVQHGIGEVGHYMKLLNTPQYLEMRNEALRNDNLQASANTAASGQYIYAPDLTVWDQAKQTNWQKELIGRAAQYTHVNTSISGGTSGIQYLVGANYHKESSVFAGDFNNERGGIHLNLSNNDVTQKFHFQITSSYSTDNNSLPAKDLTENVLVLPPNAPSLFNKDGSLNWQPDVNGNSTFINPLAPLLYRNYVSKTNNLIANGNLNYDILPGLRIGSSFGFTNLQSTDIQTNSTLAEKPEDRLIPSTQRYSLFGDSKLNTWIIEPQGSYKKTLWKGKFDGLIGLTFQHTSKDAGYIAGSGFNSDEVMQNPAAATALSSVGYLKSLYKYNSIYSRLNYTVKERYILNLTARRDGSTRFGKKNKFNNFWSIGTGWIFTSEPFFSSRKSFLSFGKLKAGYGTTGSDQIGDYRFLTLYNILSPQVPYQGTTGLTPGDLPNPYLQWEETRKLDAGLDLGILNDKIFITANYSRNRSSNQLLSYLLSRITGRNSILTNFPATIENTNWEFSVNSENFKSKNFSWSTNINFTIPRNKLVKFDNLKNSSYSDSYIIGQPISLQKLYHYSGIDPATGFYMLEGVLGVPTTNPSVQTDRTQLITTFSKFYGGIQNTIHFKEFQFDFSFQYVNKIAPTTEFGFWYSPGKFFVTPSTGNQPVSILNRWRKPGGNASIQKFTTANTSSFASVSSSDTYYEDASYIRLKNISLAWNLPSLWTQKMHIENCRLFLQGQNLFTLTKYEGLDPETTSFSNLPPLRVITLGLQLKM